MEDICNSTAIVGSGDGSKRPSRLICGRCNRIGHTSRWLECPLFAWKDEQILEGVAVYKNKKALIDAIFDGKANLNPINLSNYLVEEKSTTSNSEDESCSKSRSLRNRGLKLVLFKPSKRSGEEWRIKKSQELLAKRYRDIDQTIRRAQFISLPRDVERNT